jgi:hypothetical protein
MLHFATRDLNVPINMKEMLRWIFFLIFDESLKTFFIMFLMLQTMIFDVVSDKF